MTTSSASMRLAAVALIAAFALSMQPLHAAPAPEVVLPKGVLPVTAVYVAKGPPDSCGPGCDRWIAVEGKMDAGAAERLRKHYLGQKSANLPIYLHSPGGDVRQGLAMGRLLRARKATARVARTLVKECGADAQGEAACLKLKQSGRELEAELVETGAICNSSCAYTLIGALTREIAPEVTIGVHSAQVSISFTGGRAPPKAVREQFASHAMARLERDLAGYVTAMGIDRGLLELIKTVKFEQMHALRREELLRFGIDKRELVETSWRFVDRGERTSHIDKLVQQRDADQPQGFRTMRWRLGCSSASNMRVDYRNNGRESLASAVIRFGADQKIVLAATRDAQVRGARVDAPVVEQLKSASQLSLMEVLKESSAPPRETIMSTEGLAPAADQLAKTCRTS
jgi:hypothetical protein